MRRGGWIAFLIQPLLDPSGSQAPAQLGEAMLALPAEQARVQGDDDGRERHQCGAEGGTEQEASGHADASGERDREDVAARAPGQALAHVGVGRARKRDDQDSV